MVWAAAVRPWLGRPNLPHNEFIAQLRGIAVLMVVMLHCSGFPLFASGGYGNAIFFAISGFLITGNILDRYGSLAAIDIREFYRMRAGRILPCLVLLLALLSTLSLMNVPEFIFPASSSLGGSLWHVATLTFNLYQKGGADTPNGWAVLWSLSVEEAFYLLFPIAAIVLRSEKLLVAGMLCIVANGLRDRTHNADLLSYSGSFDLIDIGVLSAIAAHRFALPVNLISPIKWAAGLVSLGTYFFLPIHGHETVGPCLIAFATALMLFASKFAASKRSGRFRPLAVAGECSYEIYLFHFTIWSLIAPALAIVFGPGSVIGLAAFLLIVFAFCIVLRRSFSTPMNRLIRSGSHGILDQLRSGLSAPCRSLMGSKEEQPQL
jgi:peptidoglycan/LPS O-acetylase OafA/YrhL